MVDLHAPSMYVNVGDWVIDCAKLTLHFYTNETSISSHRDWLIVKLQDSATAVTPAATAKTQTHTPGQSRASSR